ncbi:hypothetical protein SAMN02745221_02146 [Thermosyntropha lipolytica DSM 11003]|uniref:Uncharacterized protein n=1 Tax=Thermosyntropha lipolytica DSM 11003 TaxID=1123382 RepID=A0A1M5S1Q9_9FIRM|nr:hypothetical protein [Thermosyntropha lipolytica]SHH31963.1 hypothetical protein SAMN02745221_02146 [Thermosyntropha lipolytica DSM 11003]
MDIKKPESSQEKKQRFIVIRPEDANIEFVDLVQANWNPERVVLTFIQTGPGGAVPADLPEEEYAGRLVSQIAVTWPHLVRIRDLLDKAIQENKKSVIEVTINAFSESKKTGGEKNE